MKMVDLMKPQSRRDRALEILHALEADAELVPESIREWWVSYLRGQVPRYLETLEFIERRQLSGKVLEVGSVPGQFTVLLRKLGYDVRGVDLEPGRVECFLEKHGVTVDRVDVERDPLPFPSGSFDLALFAELLEHLRINPLHALREVHRVLKPDGHILLTTPNISPVDRLLFLMGKDYQDDPVTEFGKLERVGHMGHIRLYSLDEVRRFLESVGFESREHAYLGSFRGGWKARLMRLLVRDRERWREFLLVLGGKRGQTPLVRSTLKDLSAGFRNSL